MADYSEMRKAKLALFVNTVSLLQECHDENTCLYDQISVVREAVVFSAEDVSFDFDGESADLSVAKGWHDALLQAVRLAHQSSESHCDVMASHLGIEDNIKTAFQVFLTNLTSVVNGC